MKIKISKIRRDGGTQMRAERNSETVDEYRDKMLAGEVFPPIVVFFDGSEYWLADGFQRAEAAEDAEQSEIECDVREGGQRDAILYACGANADHGARRTNADKRKAVMTLLNDDEWKKKSNNWISGVCHVDSSTVDKHRKSLPDSGSAEVETSDGRTMNTSKIGRAGGRFKCDCGEEFSEEVWHCSTCEHHWPMSKEDCSNCQNGTKAKASKTEKTVFNGDTGEIIDQPMVETISVKPFHKPQKDNEDSDAVVRLPSKHDKVHELFMRLDSELGRPSSQLSVVSIRGIVAELRQLVL